MLLLLLLLPPVLRMLSLWARSEARFPMSHAHVAFNL